MLQNFIGINHDMFMKRLLAAAITVLIFACPVEAFAKSYEVDPFYALRSYTEYERVQGSFGDLNNIFYGWSRVARDSDGHMVFTDRRESISKYDTFNNYCIPEPVDGKLTNEINKSAHPGSRNLLMVFFNRIIYDDGRDSIIDFLNMSSDEWGKLIIQPLVDSMNAHDFDGVVLDIEGIADSYAVSSYPEGENSNLKDKYNLFLDMLREYMQDKELVVCVNMPQFTGYDYSHIYSVSDRCLLLAYPYQHYTLYNENCGVPFLIGRIKEVDVPEAEPYSKIKADVGSVASILKQKYGTNYKPEKIILGTTIEITGWVKKEYVYNSKSYTYYEKTDSLDRDDSMKISTLEGIENLDVPDEYIDISPVYKYESRTCKKTVTSGLEYSIKSIEYYYDTPQTIFEKYYTLARDYGLGGISIWRIGIGDFSEDENIWGCINNIFEMCSDGYNECPYASNVPLDKVWNVKFSAPLDESTLVSAKENVAVVDEYGKIIQIKFNCNEELNTVSVSPSAAYKPGKLYYLVIGKNIKSAGGQILSKPVIQPFITKYGK